LAAGIDSTWQAIGQQVFDGRDERFLRRCEAIGQIILDRLILRGKSLC
jgi:hypothetical protein